MFSELTAEAASVLKQQFGLDDVQFNWQVPRDLSHGDAATSVALQVAKRVGKKPQEIAQTLATALAMLPSVERADVAGAGYVNVWLTTDAILAELNTSLESCTPREKKDDAKPVIV